MGHVSGHLLYILQGACQHIPWNSPLSLMNEVNQSMSREYIDMHIVHRELTSTPFERHVLFSIIGVPFHSSLVVGD